MGDAVKLKILFIAFMSLLFCLPVQAADPPIGLDMQNSVMLWEPVTVNLVINDRDLRKEIKQLQIEGTLTSFNGRVVIDGEHLAGRFPYDASQQPGPLTAVFYANNIENLPDSIDIPFKLMLVVERN